MEPFHSNKLMEAIQRDTIMSLSDSVKVFLENHVLTALADNFKRPELIVSILKKLKKTLLDLQHVLCYDLEKRIPNRALDPSLDLLRSAFFQLVTFFEEIASSFRYEYDTPININLLRYLVRLNHVMCEISSETKRLIEISQGSSVSNSITVSHETVSDDESLIYGRDTDVEKLKDILLSNSDDKIRVISIVGMGGVGKTALAKYLYNDPQVKDNFELQVWADFSEDVDDFSVFEAIFESITTSQTTISQSFLLVLDGVWDARSVNWTCMYIFYIWMYIFNIEETRSKVIITTRDERIAKSMQTFTSVHYLRPLEIEDCWSLVASHAFRERSYQQRSNLENIGRKIAKKCEGLPLAAVIFGALLRTLLFPNDWNYVLESNVRHIAYEVHAALELSYNILSDPLKRCFEYCSIFPKNSILEKKVLVQLWIAAGLVEESSTDQEKVGEEYFDALVSKSLIHRQSISDEEDNFEMHNFIHDLATEVSSPYCINMDEHNLHDRVHNISYNRRIYDSYNRFYKLSGLKGLRTFLALPLQEQMPHCLLSNKVVYKLLPTMKQLRVLSLSSYKSLTKIPNSIGNLSYMRYLNLSHTNIESLPSQISKLYNLQFLLLAGCKRFTELPKDIGKLVNLYYLDVSNTALKEMPGEMGKLVNLRYLDVSDTALREMPIQIAKFQDLQTLSDFVVSKHNDGLKVSELGKFPNLQGKLSISQLQNVTDPIEASKANMKMKERIEKLALEWDCGTTFSDPRNQSIVLELLQPSTNLKSLTIKGFGGVNIPNWLGDSLFDSMVYLRISSCDNCIWLPPLGQLGNLKELNIDSMPSIKSVGIEFYGNGSSASFQPFPSLETLCFEDMPEWEEWNMIEGPTMNFPNLKRLLLSKCPKLQGDIPHTLPSLIELELRGCPLLVESRGCPLLVESRGCPLLVESRHSSHNDNIISIIPMSDVFHRLMLPLNSLQQLTLDDFPSLTSFPTNGLPKTLKFLIISNCENLEFLPHEYLHSYTSLEELKISYSCNSMISFTLGALPILKSLFIEGCINLKSILIAEDVSQKSLSFLRSIKIWDCNELESFPPGGLATPNLIYFAVWKCEKLLSLPEAMHRLTNLREMEIDNLPNLQSFVIDDLPSSLQELTVGSVGGIMRNTEPTWEHLTCLSVLRINSDDSVNMLMGPFLPLSLVTLCIYDLNDTVIDGKWFQHLKSLQKLEIVNAPKLKSLPKEGLPPSLYALSITCCPLLEASLQRKRGKEWRKVARIPFIIINDKMIT